MPFLLQTPALSAFGFGVPHNLKNQCGSVLTESSGCSWQRLRSARLPPGSFSPSRSAGPADPLAASPPGFQLLMLQTIKYGSTELRKRLKPGLFFN
ncbi:Hypothetical predicted protein [Marmota monax]|uniref:Uncharacterized protein n=1 Tax=Marmota monax TaxID=9995 RepID=A0A5E4CIQ9_MARMO|nr:Hypothetical predicted protein [Marmota monax]